MHLTVSWAIICSDSQVNCLLPKHLHPNLVIHVLLEFMLKVVFFDQRLQTIFWFLDHIAHIVVNGRVLIWLSCLCHDFISIFLLRFANLIRDKDMYRLC